jgi:ABC-type Fe3+/spermidine/putrescine transport system ATPase subunit
LAEKAIEVRDLTKSFPGVTALNKISFDVNKGDFFIIIGPSGCGKTTLLRCLVGLTRPDEGSMLIGGKDMVDVPTHRRNIGLIFQYPTLFPHKTISENIAFGLRMEGHSLDKIRSGVRNAMNLVGIEGMENKMPKDLSVGQQQSVSLARSLVLQPEILLFDEALGSLDYVSQKRMMLELKQLHQRIQGTFLYVTHDQEQAMALASKLMVMNMGHIEQIGSPTEVYDNPNTVFVARFLGEINMFRGEVTSFDGNIAQIKTDLGTFGAATLEESKVKRVAYAVRPEKMQIGQDAEKCTNRIEVRYLGETYKGSKVEYLTRVATGEQFKIVKQTELKAKPGETVFLGWDLEDALLLDKPSVVPGIDIDSAVLGA